MSNNIPLTTDVSQSTENEDATTEGNTILLTSNASYATTSSQTPGKIDIYADYYY